MKLPWFIAFLSKKNWAFSVAALLLLIAVLFLFLKLGLWALASALAAFVLLCLHVAIGILDSVKHAFPRLVTPRVYRVIYAFLLTVALTSIVHEGGIELAGGPAPPQASSETTSDEQRLPQEELVHFVGNFLLAKRLGADTQLSPSLRATVHEPILQNIDFVVPESWNYQLALQMTDGPFIDQQQDQSDYLTLVTEGRTTAQTFRVSENARTIGAVRVLVEARSIVNNLAATTEPDAPLTATLYTISSSGERVKIGQESIPPEQAGINDTWKWATFPFDIDLSEIEETSFAIKFTSSSSVIGWALSHVTNGFDGTADFYEDGEMFVNDTPYELGGDLKFEILVRNEQDESPVITVDENVLTFARVDDEQDWYISKGFPLEKGDHTLSINSSNPHISFYKFIFIQEAVSEEEEIPKKTNIDEEPDTETE